MNHNPYTPPQANTEVSIPREVVSRPVSVWLLIVLLLVLALMLVTAAVRFVGAASTQGDELREAVQFAAILVWRLLLIVVFLAAAYGAYRRQRWSRWFGVTVIVAFAAFTVFGADTTRYASDDERAGGQLARFVAPLFLAWWAYVLAFSSKARRYFSKSVSGAS